MGENSQIKRALESQYLAALAMMRDCIQYCPEELWLSGTFPRNTWRIAYHGLFYTDLYSGQTDQDFAVWSGTTRAGAGLWKEDEGADPNETPYLSASLMDYCDWLAAEIPKRLAAMDIMSQTCGIPWYDPFPKLDHQILNIRHLNQHVGQVSQIMMDHGVDGVDGEFWKSRGYD